jgi:hypothetical protein
MLFCIAHELQSIGTQFSVSRVLVAWIIGPPRPQGKVCRPHVSNRPNTIVSPNECAWSVRWLARIIRPLPSCLVPGYATLIAHGARSHAGSTPSKASEGGTNRWRGDACPALSRQRSPKALILIAGSQDTLGVGGDCESRIHYNIVDEIAGVAY